MLKGTNLILNADVDKNTYLVRMKSSPILVDVPRPLSNDLWVFLFKKIDAKGEK